MAKQTFFEGQTATNPDSGEKIVFSKGRWAPLGAVAPALPKVAEKDEGYLNDLRTKAITSLRNATEAQRFLKINQGTETGGMAGWPIIGGMVREYKASRDPKFAEMESIGSAIAPTMRPPGSGSSSDTDIRMYQRGFVNTMNPLEANKAIERRVQQQSDFDSAHAAFLDMWARKTGSINGAESAFTKYWSTKSATPPAAVPVRLRPPAAPQRGEQSAGVKYLGTE